MSSLEVFDDSGNLVLSDQSQLVLSVDKTEIYEAKSNSYIPLSIPPGSLLAISAYGLPPNNPGHGENIRYQFTSKGIKIGNDPNSTQSPNIIIKYLSLKSVNNDKYLSTYKSDGSHNWSVEDFKDAPLLTKKLVMKGSDNSLSANAVWETLKPNNRVWFLTNSIGSQMSTQGSPGTVNNSWVLGSYFAVEYTIANPYNGGSYAAGFALFTNQARPLGDIVAYVVEF